MKMWILGHILAAGIGVSLGLIGGGGSVLAVPILIYVMGISPKPAIAMTLVIVGTTSLIGMIPHWQQGNVNLQKAAIFGSATMLGAFIGAKIASLPVITGVIQLILFAAMMIVAAGFMIMKSSKSTKQISRHQDLELYPQPVCKYCWLWLLTEGFLVGILTGLVGVGGGFAIVPALVLLGKTPMKEAIGTSLLILVCNSVAGFLGYLGQVPLDWQLMGSFTVAASLGVISGSYLAKYVDAKQLQKSFGYFLLAVAAFILFQNRNAFSTPRQAEIDHKVNLAMSKNF
ncbi:MAG: sulfite exporter TauE/SafE family protein [Coleofasciculaceae cyanobacterium SM2_1_6]|nr:sulfite exporter TauE/SafE family protein [Coleofasciculaceae cyanobacterium SM2_1_6]